MFQTDCSSSLFSDPSISTPHITTSAPLDQGGRVAVIGGINMGTAPIFFNTSDMVESYGMSNYGNVKFERSQDIRFYNSVNHAAGKVHFKGVHASMLSSVNHGKIIVEDGTYNVFKSFNTGEILVKGDATSALVRSDGNTGKLVVEGGTFDVVAMLNEGQVDVSGNTQVTATLVYNKGAITIGNGVTGTLTLLVSLPLPPRAPLIFVAAAIPLPSISLPTPHPWSPNSPRRNRPNLLAIPTGQEHGKAHGPCHRIHRRR